MYSWKERWSASMATATGCLQTEHSTIKTLSKEKLEGQGVRYRG
jgi:hypothetical protein